MIIASMVAAIGLDMAIARRLYHPVNRQMANRARSVLGEVMVIWITTNVLSDSSLVSESCEARKTVEVLLQRAGTSDCEQVDEILSSLTKLNLTAPAFGDNKITDVSPLSGLTNLIWLELKNNPVAQPNCPVRPPDICSF